MTNSNVLRGSIIENGYTVPSIAVKIGISEQSFYNKLNNKTEFKASEIDKICGILGISMENRMRIFFSTD